MGQKAIGLGDGSLVPRNNSEGTIRINVKKTMGTASTTQGSQGEKGERSSSGGKDQTTTTE